MKILFPFLLVALIFASSHTIAQESGSHVNDSLTMQSEILGMEREYAIYLPPGYETSSRSYPVLYLLHGMTDDQTGWVQFGEVQHITDKAIAEGKATPMIIVMPDADTVKPGFFNDIRGKWNYEDFFFQEFMPFIEKTYRIRAEKRYRAVAGLSMGGGGSFMYALHHPELFSAACPLSGYAGPMNLEDARKSFNTPKRLPKEEWPKPVDDETIERYLDKHHAVRLMEQLPAKDIASVRWYIDCGDEDFLFEGNSLVHITMMKRKIPHEYRVRDGGHRWSYWRSALPDVLAFVTEGFHQR